MRNIIYSKTRKMFSDAILSFSLTSKNEHELCMKLYMSKDPLRHHTIRGRENVQMSTRLREKITSLHIKEYATPN